MIRNYVGNHLKRISFVLLVLANLFVFVCTNSCFAGQATLLAQDSSVTGPQNIYITPKAVRIDNQKTGTTIVAKAPKWDLDLYNKRNRTTFHCAPEKFHASFFQEITKVYREDLPGLKWKKEAEENRNGVMVAKFAVHPDGKQGKLNLMSVPVRNADYWMATNFNLPPKVCNVMSRLASMPQLNFVPIACTYYGTDGQSTSPLSTKSIKKISVVDPFFEIPKFPPAASERDVFIDVTAREAIEGMFGDDK